VQDPEQKIARPRQIYTGIDHRQIRVKQEESTEVKVG
jgi:hypothetical protein